MAKDTESEGFEEEVVDDQTGSEEQESEETASGEEEESSEKEDESGEHEEKEEEEAKKKAQEDEKAKAKRSVTHRIRRATARQREAEQEAAYYRSRLEELSQRGHGLTNQGGASTSEVKAPDPKDFERFGGEFSDEYRRAYSDYLVERTRAEVRAEFETSRQQEADAKQAKTLARRADAVEAKGVERYDDFSEVTDGALAEFKDDQVAIEALFALDNAEDVIYHLANNPDELDQVSAKPSGARAAHFGSLAARLSARRKEAAKKITKAQPVPAQARGAGGKFESSPDATYQKLRKELK